MRYNTPDPSDSYLNSKDLIRLFEEMDSERDISLETLTENRERIAELEAMEEHTSDQAQELMELQNLEFTGSDGVEYAETGDWTPEREEEYAKLKSFIDEMEGYVSDWRYGAQLIADEVWDKYAQEQAEELHGNGLSNADWPFDCIDWGLAADRLKEDYTSGEWDGNTFWGQL